MILSRQWRPLEFLFFDLDDTLIDSEKIYNSVYDLLQLDTQILTEARSLVKLTLGPGQATARNRLLYFKKYLELRNEFSADRLLNLMGSYEQHLQRLIGNDLEKTGNRNVISQLSKEFRLGIVTNENLRTQMLKLQKIDPEQRFFEFIVTSEELGVEKPHIKIIERAISLAGVKPEKILMIGDSIKSDLVPFAERGCKVIGTRQFRDESLTGHQYQWINQLEALIQI